jgi:hypothetical protein
MAMDVQARRSTRNAQKRPLALLLRAIAVAPRSLRTSTISGKLIAAMLLAALAVPSAAMATTGTGALTLNPGVGSLKAKWTVAGNAEEVAEWKVKWRPVTEPASPWGKVVILGAGTRSYLISALENRLYQVSVRPKLTTGQIGTGETAYGTPGEEEGKEVSAYRGVNSHSPWYRHVSEAEVKREIAEAVALGVNVIRIPVEWSDIERTQGVRGGNMVTRLDLIINEANAHGLKIDGTIASAPAWASPGGKWNDAPTNPEVLRPFAKWLAERYGSKLVAVGALNEPNAGGLRKPNNEAFSSIAEMALTYTKIANAIYLGAKEGNPAVKVLFGETGNAGGFLADCLSDGIKYTGLGLHAYSDGGPPEGSAKTSTKSKVEAAHALLAAHGSSAPIWVNEWGYSIENSESVRADYTRKGVELLNSIPHVEGWAYYQLRDTELGSGQEENFGLLQYGFLRRPSFAAFQAGMLAG